MTGNYKLEISFVGLFFCFYVLLALFNASEYFVYFSIVFGLFGLICAWKIFEQIDDQPEGGEQMMEIAETLHDGSMVFLSRQYRVAFYFIGASFLVLMVAIGFLQGMWIGLCTAIAFATGAISSLLAGFFGIHAVASAGVRTAQAALEGQRSKSLALAFNGGSVVGLCVTSLGLAGIGLFFLIFARGDSAYVINGYALGASAIALMGRISASLYANATGLDRSERAVTGEDAANFGRVMGGIGANLRSVGLNADIFESYVGAIIAALAIGATSTNIPQGLRFDYMALPLLVCMAGLIVTVACIRAIPYFERIGTDTLFRHAALASAGAMSILSLLAIKIMGLSSALFIALFFGCLAGIAGGWLAEYYGKNNPDNRTTAQQLTFASVSLEKALVPIVVIAVTLLCAVKSAGLYGIALAAVGMMGTVSVTLSIKAHGSLVDNAGGIAALAGLEPEARNIIADIRAAEGIEAVTNKGFMITATTITALALFGAFAESVHIKDIDISNAGVLVGFFLGACIPFLTASLAMSSLGRLMNRCKGVASAGGTGRSDSACHIDHDAQAAIRETLSPGFIALTLPVLVSLAFGKQALAALLLGCIILGVGLILFLTHEGLWNSANPLTENPGATRAGKTFNPLKDTCVPAINVVIKTVAIICLALSALFY